MFRPWLSTATVTESAVMSLVSGTNSSVISSPSRAGLWPRPGPGTWGAVVGRISSGHPFLKRKMLSWHLQPALFLNCDVSLEWMIHDWELQPVLHVHDLSDLKVYLTNTNIKLNNHFKRIIFITKIYFVHFLETLHQLRLTVINFPLLVHGGHHGGCWYLACPPVQPRLHPSLCLLSLTEYHHNQLHQQY